MYLIALSANPFGIRHKGRHDTPNITLINTHAKSNGGTDLRSHVFERISEHGLGRLTMSTPSAPFPPSSHSLRVLSRIAGLWLSQKGYAHSAWHCSGNALDAPVVWPTVQPLAS